MSDFYTQETPATVKDAKGLHLITMSTGNGQKAQIMVEELKELYGLECTSTLINIATGDQKKDWYRHLSPSARIPFLIDNTQSPPFTVMETAAIMLYLLDLADKDNVLRFEDKFEQSQAMQWLLFYHSVTPIQSQVVFWNRFAPEKNPSALAKYKSDFLRLIEIIEDHLSGKSTGQPRDYLAGNGKGKYSFADIATWPQINKFAFTGLTEEDTKPFPHVLKYIRRIGERPAVERGSGDAYNLK